MAWLVTRYCASKADGRASSSTAAMPRSWCPASWNSVAGVPVETRDVTRPMNTGIVVSSRATSRPVANKAATSHGAWPMKCQ